MRFPKHPVAVRTVFRHCVLANFSVEPEALARALPAPLTPAIAHGRAWLSIVIAQMEKMRPSFIPRPLGVTYNQIVYRAVVDCDGRRGVHFLRSDADSRLMCSLGNLMSFFRFHHGTVDIAPSHDRLRVDARSAGDPVVEVHASFDLSARRPELPESSAFASLHEAKQWLVELFDAYHPPAQQRPIDLVSIERNDWQLQVVPNTGDYSFLHDGMPFAPGSAVLDSVFVVEDLHYRWHRLRQIA